MARVGDVLVTWWPFVLLGLAAYRTFKLLATDVLLNRPRRWVLRLGGWQSGPAPPGYRESWGEWLVCPWCAGFWLAAGWWAAWWVWPHATLVVAVPWALSTVVAGLARVLDE